MRSTFQIGKVEEGRHVVVQGVMPGRIVFEIIGKKNNGNVLIARDGKYAEVPADKSVYLVAA